MMRRAVGVVAILATLILGGVVDVSNRASVRPVPVTPAESTESRCAGLTGDHEVYCLAQPHTLPRLLTVYGDVVQVVPAGPALIRRCHRVYVVDLVTPDEDGYLECLRQVAAGTPNSTEWYGPIANEGKSA